MVVYLEKITVRFPSTNTEFTNSFASLISAFGQNENGVLKLTSSEGFYPKLLLDFQSEHSDILTDFSLSNGETICVTVENSTGLSKRSPHSYQHLSAETVVQRLVASEVRLVGIDHIGVNFPWFSSDLHPRIFQLRKELSSRCLYHRFPTGEPWDFIIPGDGDEIVSRRAVDYTKVRRPKFELVSFGSASTPLVQFDIGVNIDYERFSQLFPEALNDPAFRNIWIYLKSPYTVDVCLVINEFTEHDWSDFFKESRL